MGKDLLRPMSMFFWSLFQQHAESTIISVCRKPQTGILYWIVEQFGNRYSKFEHSQKFVMAQRQASSCSVDIFEILWSTFWALVFLSPSMGIPICGGLASVGWVVTRTLCPSLAVVQIGSTCQLRHSKCRRDVFICFTRWQTNLRILFAMSSHDSMLHTDCMAFRTKARTNGLPLHS